MESAMQWKQFKEAKGQIGNVEFRAEYSDGSLRTLTFSVDGKDVLMCGQGRYSDFTANVPAPPKKEKRFVLSGKLLGVSDINEVFEDEYSAKSRKDEIASMAAYPTDEKLGLAIEQTEVDVPF